MRRMGLSIASLPRPAWTGAFPGAAGQPIPALSGGDKAA
ncbi:hypothetical protein ppKF707_2304 [Metapseudomonas furukawaii]|uniref:Uncharacterized protein n=1 Tax=Metapseudomonas furukawaii TaxID=1149133 RepID=A0AAD1C3G9_METFU|nr:hypothetical protein ppKF707_2304 [Pseudomonas furukawaii]BAU76759.1 hypothetical protein KF707C_50710 [Pseudomonas furukawaii]